MPLCLEMPLIWNNVSLLPIFKVCINYAVYLTHQYVEDFTHENAVSDITVEQQRP